MVNTSELAEKLSGTPKYGSRILCTREELQKAHKLNGVQIYVDSKKYFFKYPEDNDIYICIGEVGVCDELTVLENFAKIITALGLKTEKGKLVNYLNENEEYWWNK